MTDELHDLAAPYALDALDDDERERFERHLHACVECRQQVDALREGAAHLGSAFEEAPPAAMRARVLEAAEHTPQDRSMVPLRRGRRWSLPRVATAVAAVLVVTIGLALVTGLLVDDLTADDVLAADDVVTHGLTVTEAYPGGPVEATVAVSTEEEAAVLTFAGLVPAGPELAYAAWVIHDGIAVPAGLFEPGSGGAVQALVTESVTGGVTIAVTAEPASGSDAPTGDILFTVSI